MIIKLYNKVKKDGLDSLWYRFLRLFNKNLLYNNLIEKRKFENSIKLYDDNKNLILSGPYKDTKFSRDNFWGIGDLGAKIVGVYELEVQNKLIEIVNKFKIENFINVGAAEGYHAVGLAKKTGIQNFILYECDTKGQEILKRNIALNNINKNITIKGEAKIDNLLKLKNEINLNKTLFLNEVLNELKNSYLIIENHSFLMNGINQKTYEKFVNNLNQVFNLEKIHNSYRNIYNIDKLKEFSEDEIMLLCSEGRPRLMEWFVLLPK